MTKKYFYDAKVLKISDGDTCDVLVDLGFNVFHKCKLRLDGINTPESRTKNLREKKLGLEAKAFTQRFLKDMHCQIRVRKKGKFGRWLAEVFVNNRSLNKALLNAGLAKVYHGEKRKGWFE